MRTDSKYDVVVVFEDKNDDGLILSENYSDDDEEIEVLDRMIYYPFGLRATGTYTNPDHAGLDPARYSYNGKEHQEHAQMLDYGARWYDPGLGRWMQVDPKAAKFYGMSPYCAMGNSPMTMVDPEGDEFWRSVLGAIPVIGGFISNGLANRDRNMSFWYNGYGALFKGVTNGLMTFSLGSVTSGFGWLGQAGTHAFVQGSMAHGNGGNFWHAALAGGASSIVGGITASSGVGIQIAAGGLSGGVGSLIAGGDFWEGVGVGLTVAALNHALHGGAEESGGPETLPDGRAIYDLSPEEFALFASAETRHLITGCKCDIKLTIAERIWLAGKTLELAFPTARVSTLLRASDFVRFSKRTLVSNQLIKGEGAVGAQRIPAFKGGGTNPTTGATLPYHFHIHRYNWWKPHTWFTKTPIIKP